MCASSSEPSDSTTWIAYESVSPPPEQLAVYRKRSKPMARVWWTAWEGHEPWRFCSLERLDQGGNPSEGSRWEWHVAFGA